MCRIAAFILMSILCTVSGAAADVTLNVHIHGTVTDTTGTLNLSDATINYITGDDTSSVTTLADGSYSTYIDVEMNSTGMQAGPGPERIILHQNYPNPFNPSTVIPFDLNQPAQVSLHVYSVTGQRVRTLAEGYFSAGAHNVIWDGIDDSGRPVSSGVYIYRLVSNGTQTVRKMVLLDSGVSSARVSVGAQRIAEPLSMSGSVTIIVDRAGYEQYSEENITIFSDQQELEKDFGLTIHDFFPLAVGNTWTYKGIDGSLGWTTTITDTTYIEGNKYYQVEPWVSGLQYSVTECISPLWVRKNNLGDFMVRFNSEDIVAIPFSMTNLYENGMNDNLCWGFFYKLEGIGNTFPVIPSVDTGLFPDKIITPLGTYYECSSFYFNLSDTADASHYCIFIPDIGLVQMQVFSYGLRVIELVSATVNGIQYPQGVQKP